jgi:hypothetical protein
MLPLFIVSCINYEEKSYIDLKNIDQYIEKIAPIKEGYTTNIVVNNELICQTNIEIPYLLQKDKKDSIFYTPNTKSFSNGGWSSYHQIVCFEDTRNGDNDYNDFICWITTVVSFDHSNYLNPKTIIQCYVQPIAYGASLSFKFGIKYPDNQVWITSQDAKPFFFNDYAGYVNTEYDTWNNPNPNSIMTNNTNYIKKLPIIIINGHISNPRINPFIIVNNDTLYAAIYNHNLEENQYTSLNGYPLGITFGSEFKYPIEKININRCYDDFNNWITGNIDILNKDNPLTDSVFQRITNFIYYNPQNLYK